MWAVIVYMVLSLISLGVRIALHGYRIKINAVSSLLAIAFKFYLLYKGGFFNCFFD